MIAVIFLACVWGVGNAIRLYRQARFYQIEEYKSPRYLRWWLKERAHWLPTRPLLAVALAAGFSIFTDTLPDGVSLLPYIVMGIGALVAVIPADEGVIKKKFVRTPRATRIIATAISLASAVLIILLLLVTRTGSDRTRAIGISLAGLAVFLAAPLFLICANLLMTPLETFLRRRFIARARKVLADLHPKVIGITGSFGKTTTKNFLRDILNVRYKAYATPKSYNTMMGVCIALNNDLAQDYSVEYFISEMGAYVEGEIRRICDLTPPDISIVTEVGPQHLERFGSLDNIAAAKYEIIRSLPADGLGIFNYDNPYVRAMYDKGYPANRIGVSRVIAPETVTDGVPRFIASDVRDTLNGLAFTVTDTVRHESLAFSTPVVGEHNVMNILLATAVAVHEGIPLRDVAQRVATLQPAESRLVRQVNERGVTIINDAYSANPVGMVSALKVLGMHPKRKVLVTPGMIELGALHAVENARLGTLATQYATDIVLIGEKQTAPIQQAIRQTAFPPENLYIMPNVADAIAWYQRELTAGDAVLLLNDLPDTY